jgi:hypothetical protein
MTVILRVVVVLQGQCYLYVYVYVCSCHPPSLITVVAVVAYTCMYLPKFELFDQFVCKEHSLQQFICDNFTRFFYF